MYMNMCIVMYMNIYITKANEEWLRKQDKSMSGIINEALEKLRDASPLQVAKEIFEDEMDTLSKQPPRIPGYRQSYPDDPVYTNEDL